jgi:hypothetical protein
LLVGLFDALDSRLGLEQDVVGRADVLVQRRAVPPAEGTPSGINCEANRENPLTMEHTVTGNRLTSKSPN